MLVAEACNHNRITDICNDIGMVQVGGVGVVAVMSCVIGSNCVIGSGWGQRQACSH